MEMNQVKINETTTVPIEFKITGDMMFLAKIYGHCGPGSVYPCCICLAKKDDLRAEVSAELRTMEGMKRNSIEFQVKP